jgi:uncharacterized protein YggU (UPF0235/DUF167 family)
VRLAIRVKPGSSRASVGGRHGAGHDDPGSRGDALVVAVTARAVDGKATEAALRAVADAFGVKRRAVTLVTGATSRDKVVEVDGDAGALAARRDILLDGGMSVPGGGIPAGT